MGDFLTLVFVLLSALTSHFTPVQLIFAASTTELYMDYDEYISACQQLDEPAKGLGLKWGGEDIELVDD